MRQTLKILKGLNEITFEKKFEQLKQLELKTEKKIITARMILDNKTYVNEITKQNEFSIIKKKQTYKDLAPSITTQQTIKFTDGFQDLKEKWTVRLSIDRKPTSIFDIFKKKENPVFTTRKAAAEYKCKKQLGTIEISENTCYNIDKPKPKGKMIICSDRVAIKQPDKTWKIVLHVRNNLLCFSALHKQVQLGKISELNKKLKKMKNHAHTYLMRHDLHKYNLMKAEAARIDKQIQHKSRIIEQAKSTARRITNKAHAYMERCQDKIDQKKEMLDEWRDKMQRQQNILNYKKEVISDKIHRINKDTKEKMNWRTEKIKGLEQDKREVYTDYEKEKIDEQIAYEKKKLAQLKYQKPVYDDYNDSDEYDEEEEERKYNDYFDPTPEWA
jgi:hypothetical protein